jgi:hypothetical protein
MSWGMGWSDVVSCETPQIRAIAVYNVCLSVQIELLVGKSRRLRLANRMPGRCGSRIRSITTTSHFDPHQSRMGEPWRLRSCPVTNRRLILSVTISPSCSRPSPGSGVFHGLKEHNRVRRMALRTRQHGGDKKAGVLRRVKPVSLFAAEILH